MSSERKRSLSIAGHRTSISLEDEFWEALKEIAATEGQPVSALVVEVDSRRGELNLSSALRLHALSHYRRLAAEHQGNAGP
jgi:predicted DNA-binding ribbon-helix-helix protein